MQNKEYYELIERDNTNPKDNERRALFTIFSENEDLYSKIDFLYDFQNHWIKTDCFKKADFSSGNRKMVELAFNLYNCYKSSTPLEIFSLLDSENYDLAMKAINIRFNKI